MTELIAIVAPAADAPTLTWDAFEVRGFIAQRRRQGEPRAPGYVGKRVTPHADLTTLGVMLGSARSPSTTHATGKAKCTIATFESENTGRVSP